MTHPPPRNPYVGPRSFTTGERIYGRARESRDLTALLVAERIVLLHSPSGAGKTSLIQAALIPRLRRRAFAVRPTIRVNRVEGPTVNRYVFSVLSCLEEDPELPAAVAVGAGALAGMTLADYLGRRPRPLPEGAPAGPRARNADEVLIFDQFEEVLTVDPTDEPAKHAFFAQLGEALRLHPHIWALFSIREDYVAALDPFLRPIPTRLSNTFRLDLLSRAAAAEAMAGPAATAGVEFTRAAAERLADDLAQVVVQGVDGSHEARIGPSVEPVQLQVVCRRLWERRFGAAEATAGSGDGLALAEPLAAPTGERPQITVEDVVALGNVDQALGSYYDEGVARAAAAGTPERLVRLWFDERLISGGIRGQVRRGGPESGHIAEATIGSLLNSYLIRADDRRGSTWYELAHDRLISPVRQSNQVWFSANLNPLQRQAALWADKRSPSLLLRGAELAAAEAWLRGYDGELSAAEEEFLAASREERGRAERLRRLTVSALVAGGLALVFGLVAAGFWAQASASERRAEAERDTAEAQRGIAEDQRGTAEANRATADANYLLAEQRARVGKARELSFAAQNQLAADPELSVLLAVEALEATRPGDPAVPEAADSLQRAIQESRLRRTIDLAAAPPWGVAYRPDGARVAAVGFDGQLRVWSTDRPDAEPLVAPAHAGLASAAAYSPDGRLLATSGGDGLLRLWDGESGAPLRSTEALTVALRLSFSPDGTLLALASGAPTAVVADVATLQPVRWIENEAPIDDIAISPDNRTVAIGDPSGVQILELASGTVLRRLPHPSFVAALAFSPDGGRLLSGESRGTLYIWDLAAPPPPDGEERPLAQLAGHAGTVRRLAVSRDGALLASAGDDARVRLWSLETGQLVLTLSGHRGPIGDVALPAAGDQLATSSQDGTVRLWSLGLLHAQSARSVVYAAGGALLVSGGNDRVAYVWDAASGALVQAIPNQAATIPQLAVSPDGSLVATGGSELRVWAIGEPEPRIELPPEISARGVAFSPDGRLLATGGGDGILRLWEIATGQGEELATISGSFRSVAFSPDGRLLAAGDADGYVLLWDLAAGAEAGPPLAFGGQIARVAFSPDGGRLAVAGAVDVAQIYDLADPERPTGLSGHGESIADIAWSPDGARLATVSGDRSLRLWAADGAREGPVYTVVAEPQGLAFAPDGASVAVAGADGVVRLLPLDSAGLIALAEGRVSRTALSPEECEIYLQSGCAP